MGKMKKDLRRSRTIDDPLRQSLRRVHDVAAAPPPACPACAPLVDMTAMAPTTALKKMNHAAAGLSHGDSSGHHDSVRSAIQALLEFEDCHTHKRAVLRELLL